MSNYELQQYFLNIIKEFAIKNPDKEITSDFIYSYLMGFNIRNDQHPYQDVSYNFNTWINRYRSNPNIKVFHLEERRHFLWFTNGNIKGNEIKLYIPMDLSHLYDGANMLFDFLSSITLEHQSKIADMIRNDNVVIRVNSLEDAQTIIEFVNSNNYIKEGIVKVNPFLPNINGVGITMDNTFSYNSTVSDLIADFVSDLKRKNRLDLLTVENLNSFIKSKASSVSDLDLKDIYNLISKTTSKDFTINDFYSHARSKLSDRYTNDRKRIVDPKFYFEQAIEVTENVHPGNSHMAIIEYLKGNPNYFTNRENVRLGLIKYVHPGDVISIMRSKLIENNIEIPKSDNELINAYLNVLLQKENEMDNLNYKFNILLNAYINTYEAYGYAQARAAIQNLLMNGEVNLFTNRKKDRDLIKQNVLGDNIKKIILSNIDITNLDVNDINQIVNRFTYIVNSMNLNKRRVA